MVLSVIKKTLLQLFQEILNLKGHQKCITGSRVKAILLNGWIFPIGQSGEASLWRVCYQRRLPRLVSKQKDIFSGDGFPQGPWHLSIN